MKSRVDLTLRLEAERYQLRFDCESCAHFAPDSGLCVNEYPNAAHRGADLGARDHVEFCKEYELV